MAEKEDFKLTLEEAKSLKEALKKEEFRKLLIEYAQEISDPENKRLYEEEIAKLERERGVDVKFIHPTPGYVLKTSILPSKKKVFINICSSDLIDPATPQEGTAATAPYGAMWSIPYSLTPPRDDVDKANHKITIIDAIFNSETYKKGQEIPKFHSVLEVTALDSIERDLKLKIDRKHVKQLQQPYKGAPHSAVIRKRISKKTPEPIGPLKVPYPPLKKEMKQEKPAKVEKKAVSKKEKQQKATEPKYNVIYRGEIDYQDFTNDRTSAAVKRPKELVVTIELPGLRSAANVEVDIFERLVVLDHAQPPYHLKLPLSYPVDEDNGTAKFHKANSTLVLTLPVLPLPATPNLMEATPSTNGETSDLSTGSSDDDKALDRDVPSTALPTNHITEPISPSSSGSREVKPDWSVQEEWQCPPFSHRQEHDVVSFVLHVENVKSSTVNSHFDEHSAHVTFKGSGSSSNTGTTFSFYVTFPADCLLMSDQCSINISSDNIVLVLKKRLPDTSTTAADDTGESINSVWQSFDVGINSVCTKTKLFLTEDNIESIIHTLSFSDPWQQQQESVIEPVLKLSEVNDKETVISLSAADQEIKDSVVSENHCPNQSDEIRAAVMMKENTTEQNNSRVTAAEKITAGAAEDKITKEKITEEEITEEEITEEKITEKKITEEKITEEEITEEKITEEEITEEEITEEKIIEEEIITGGKINEISNGPKFTNTLIFDLD